MSKKKNSAGGHLVYRTGVKNNRVLATNMTDDWWKFEDNPLRPFWVIIQKPNKLVGGGNILKYWILWPSHRPNPGANQNFLLSFCAPYQYVPTCQKSRKYIKSWLTYCDHVAPCAKYPYFGIKDPPETPQGSNLKFLLSFLVYGYMLLDTKNKKNSVNAVWVTAITSNLCGGGSGGVLTKP